MNIKFEKYHGLGNDFIFISDHFFKKFKTLSEIQTFTRQICDRHYSIGADGVIFSRISKVSKKIEILIVNSDGSFAGTCGNALRCLGLKLFRSNVWNGKKPISVFRLDVAKKNDLSFSEEKQFLFDVKEPFASIIGVTSLKQKDCGHKKTVVREISILFAQPKKIAYLTDSFKLKNCHGHQNLKGIFVELENPHLVFLSPVFKHFSNEECVEFGKQVQTQHNVNVGMLTISNKIESDHPKNSKSDFVFSLRVFERGAGLTLACGSGAIAAALALQFQNCISKKITSIKLQMLGGVISVSFLKNQIIQSADAQFVFDGSLQSL